MRCVNMDFYDFSNLWIPNTKTLYRPVQLFEPKTLIIVPIYVVCRLHGIKVDIPILYLKEQDQKIIIIQVRSVFHYGLSYFGFYNLELAGSSHEKVSRSAHNPTKTLGLRLKRERWRVHS